MNGGARTARVTLTDSKDKAYDIDITFDTLLETSIPEQSN